MKAIFSTFIFSILLASNVWAAEEGWDYRNFYEEVDWCKQSIIYPAAQDYIKAGLAKNKSSAEMRTEAISMVPVFEKVGSDMCYFVFNEISKDISYKNYTRGEVVKQYMEVPRCKNSLIKDLESIKSNASQGKLN